MKIIPRTLISAIFSIGLIFTGCQYTERNNTAKEQRDYLSEVKSVDKLVLAQMTISKMATVDDIDLAKTEGIKQMAEGLIDAVKIGNRKAAYSYNTYLRAFINLSTLTTKDVKVDEANKTITLTLPTVETEFAGRDLGIREEHYRVTGLRSQIDPKERADMKEKMNKSLKKEVEEKSEFRQRLVTEARTKAESYFKTLLGADGYTVIVKFK